jgi:hypothetical protein
MAIGGPIDMSIQDVVGGILIVGLLVTIVFVVLFGRE